MGKKRFIVFVLCVMALLTAPIRAVAEYCTHPKLYQVLPEDRYFVEHGYETGFYQHREWFQYVEFLCIRCGAEILGDKDYKEWEDHEWDIDYEHPDEISGGLIFYEACCKKCNYSDTLSNYEIEQIYK